MQTTRKKSIAILFGTPQRLKSVSDLKRITVANTTIPLCYKVKFLVLRVGTCFVAPGSDNSVLYGTALKHTGRLQRVQHALARVVVNQRSRTPFSSNELLKQLHWLPLEWCIQFKLATLTFKVLHTGRPPYLTDLLQYHQSTRSLRSSFSHQLFIPRHNHLD